MAVNNRIDVFINSPSANERDTANAARLGNLLADHYLFTQVSDTQYLGDERVPDHVLEELKRIPVFLTCVGAAALPPLDAAEGEAAMLKAAPDAFRCIALLPGAAETGEVDRFVRATGESVFDLREGVTLEHAVPLVLRCLQKVRPDYFERYEDALAAFSDGSRLVALAGPTESGRAALARLLAIELRDRYPRQIWVQADPGGQDSTIRRVLEELGEVDPTNAMDPRDELRLRLGEAARLVVYDDVEFEEANGLTPPAPSAAILVCKLPSPTIVAPATILNVPPPPEARQDDLADDRQLLAGYAPDTLDGEDQLSLQVSVNALSSLVAAKEVRPPLSIGLFGDWGAGKSFFIGRMTDRIRALSEASAKAGDDSDYCSSVKQIVFNAWHYSDTNLWASLASRVFEGLNGTGEGEVQGLIAKLESSEMQLAEVEAEEDVATDQLKRATQDEESVMKEAKEVRLKVGDLTDSAREILEKNDRLPEAELLSLAGSMHELWRRSRTLALLAGSLGVAAVLLGLLAPDVYVWVGAAAAAVASVLSIGAWPLRWVLRARERAEREATDLRHRRKTELEALEREAREAARRREHAEREVEDSKRAIGEIEDGRRLYQFIDERSQNAAYGQYMGLVSLVRRDFERLSELIRQHEGQGSAGQPRLERIVLYVDDLDRCPTARVVEVLEAVHLLLASELFVVVVAVDPRWLVHSLRSRYANEMLGGDGTESSATPQDYLEKIFQVPFSLPAMTNEGYQRLVRSLIPIETREVEEPFAASTRTPAPGPVRGADAPSLLEDPQQPVQEGDNGRVAPGIDLKPPGLRIAREELDYMVQIGPLVRTPRAAKKLTNLYRLTRVSLPGPELDRLLGRTGAGAQFQYVLVLLAITVSYPTLTPGLLAEIAAAESDGDWWTFVDARQISKHQADSWRHLLAALQPLRGPQFPGQLDLFAHWSPWVARYSYGLRQLPAGDGQGAASPQ